MHCNHQKSYQSGVNFLYLCVRCNVQNFSKQEKRVENKSFFVWKNKDIRVNYENSFRLGKKDT